MVNNNIIRHGDVVMRKLSTTSMKSIPKDAVPTGEIVMHGESGHTHRIQKGQVLQLETPIQIELPSGNEYVQKFMHIPQDTAISHEEHLTLEIPKEVYVITQEREIDHLAEVERTVLD